MVDAHCGLAHPPLEEIVNSPVNAPASRQSVSGRSLWSAHAVRVLGSCVHRGPAGPGIVPSLAQPRPRTIEPHGGRIVTSYFDSGESLSLPWQRRAQAAALLAALKRLEHGFDAVAIGEP